MTPLAFFFILASAGLHATWNAIAKKQGASLAFYAMLALAGVLWSSFVRFFSPLRFFAQPPEVHAWLAGTIASELLYARGLFLSYRSLDMSTAYPMMRSIPLIFLPILTAAFGFGKPLAPHAIVGMGMVFAGCLLIPLRHISEFRLSRYCDRNFAYVLLVALGTTGYTLCDSEAQRAMIQAAQSAGTAVSKPMISLSYYSFRAITLTTTLWILVLCGRQGRADAAGLWRNRPWLTLLAGCCSTTTYILVLLAMNFVSNVSYVQAFRQLGLLFGLMEGVFILKERCTAPKVAGTVLILAGLAISVLCP